MKKRELSERLVELETRSAFQEDTLGQLDQELAKQQREIERLSRQVEILLDQIRELIPGGESKEKPPPHY